MCRPDSDCVVYPGVWPRRTPDRTLLDTAATLFYMVFAAIPGYLFLASFIEGWGFGAVFLGGLFATVGDDGATDSVRAGVPVRRSQALRFTMATLRPLFPYPRACWGCCAANRHRRRSRRNVGGQARC
jgi:hypothetical protein